MRASSLKSARLIPNIRQSPAVDGVGQRDQLACGHIAPLRIAAERPRTIGDPVADLQLGHAIAQRFEEPGRFEPQAARQGHGMQPCPVIDVDEVDPDCQLLQSHFTCVGRRQLDLGPL